VVVLLALYAGMSAGVIMTSDDLGTERLRLWKLFLNPDRRTCRFPLLGQTSLRLPPASTEGTLVVGEHSLDGSVCHARGVLPMTAMAYPMWRPSSKR
jgi:hypothetical protein